jgi:hypothetical protein
MGRKKSAQTRRAFLCAIPEIFFDERVQPS